MRYAKINPNDIANGEGVCVSLFVSGCPHRCKGCFNPETWDFDYGAEFTLNEMKFIIEALDANGVQRNFSVLGGEPLAPANRETVLNIIKTIKLLKKDIKVYLWTGYYLENIANEPLIKDIMLLADYIIDGPFIEDQKDLTLKLRGSSNQRIWDLTNIENYDIIK